MTESPPPVPPTVPSPAASAPAAPAPAPVPDGVELAGDRVLVVDDDPLIQRMLKAGLEKHGYTVAIAGTGYEAGFLTVDFAPHCMLLDINLPDLDGDLVCRRIRASERTQALPIIGISATSDQGRIQAMYEAGITAFLPKPFTIDALREQVVAHAGPIRPAPPRPKPVAPRPVKLLAALVVLAALGALAAYQWWAVEQAPPEVIETTRVIEKPGGERLLEYRGEILPEREVQRRQLEERMARLGKVFDEETQAWVPASFVTARTLQRERERQRAAGRLQDAAQHSSAPRPAQAEEAARAAGLEPYRGRYYAPEEIAWWQTEDEALREGRRFFEGAWYPRAHLKTWGRVQPAEGEPFAAFVAVEADGTLRVTTGAGQRTLPAGTHWEPAGVAPYQAYWDRAQSLGVAPGRADQHAALAEWCQAQGFPEAARREYRLALRDDRQHEAARAALGYRRAEDGSWRRE